jgi:serine/threonine-protein kinase
VLGQRVNNFEIVRLLGQGGMGAVYEAEHRVIRRKVAIKVLKPELAMDGELVQRFFNEARATSAIQHPNIVEVIDLGVLPDGIPYLVMELLEGESLGDRLARLDQLDPALVVEFASQTADALEAAHATGIVHRDLKPDNLFLVRDERFADRELVKVLDFGIAKLRGDPSGSAVTTAAGTIWGTPPYMSPEQCRGLPGQIDHRTDIYALGVIIYEALCGRPPFLGEGLGDVMMMHMGSAPDPVSHYAPHVPQHIERAVHKALAKHPDERFSSMAEFRAALRPSTVAVLSVPKLVPGETRRSAPAAVAVLGGATPRGTFGTPSTLPPLRMSAAPNLLSTDPDGETANDHTYRQIKSPAGGVQALAATAFEASDTQLQSSVPAPVAAVAGDFAGTDTGRMRASRRRGLMLIAGALAGLVLLVIVPWTRRSRVAPEPSPQTTPALHATGALPRALEARSIPSAQTTAAVPTSVPQQQQTLPPVPAQKPQLATLKPQSRQRADPKSNLGLAPTSTRESTRSKKGSTLAKAVEPSPGNKPEKLDTKKSSEPALTTSESAVAPGPATLAPGYLSLDSEPWANVSLNGKQLGSTPLVKVPLPPGKHVLTLTNPELGISTSYAVDIKSGALLSRLVGWRK